MSKSEENKLAITKNRKTIFGIEAQVMANKIHLVGEHFNFH